MGKFSGDDKNDNKDGRQSFDEGATNIEIPEPSFETDDPPEYAEDEEECVVAEYWKYESTRKLKSGQPLPPPYSTIEPLNVSFREWLSKSTPEAPQGHQVASGVRLLCTRKLPDMFQLEEIVEAINVATPHIHKLPTECGFFNVANYSHLKEPKVLTKTPSQKAVLRYTCRRAGDLDQTITTLLSCDVSTNTSVCWVHMPRGFPVRAELNRLFNRLGECCHPIVVLSVILEAELGAAARELESLRDKVVATSETLYGHETSDVGREKYNRLLDLDSSLLTILDGSLPRARLFIEFLRKRMDRGGTCSISGHELTEYQARRIERFLSIDEHIIGQLEAYRINHHRAVNTLRRIDHATQYESLSLAKEQVKQQKEQIKLANEQVKLAQEQKTKSR